MDSTNFSLDAFTPGTSFLGGLLIGTSAALLLLFIGRIAGVTGILDEALHARGPERSWRIWFLGGLLSTGLILRLIQPGVFGAPLPLGPGVLFAAGLLVGFGTRLGNGCTSGHGVCGIGRLSQRSLIATAVFIASGAATVLLMRLASGGHP